MKTPAPALINLPDETRLIRLLGRVLRSGQLSNNGPIARELEDRLAEHLGVEHLVLCSSGTLALEVAYKALGLTGDVVTTPFTWLTTASSLRWVGLRPRFADVDPHSFNLDPAEAEAAITPATSAILAVHAYGNPADIAAIEEIAARHGLRTVYDGAHAFGALYRGRSALAWGDATTLSLHATKLFHTVEGGAVILRDADTCARARLAVNNGLDAEGAPRGTGINGRLSELHAAVGLVLIDDIDSVLSERRLVAEALRSRLVDKGVRLQRLNPDGTTNHAYFPAVFPNQTARDRAATALAAAGLPARAYFDTPLNRVPGIGDGSAAPVSESLAQRVLCLPLRIGASCAERDRMAHLVEAAVERRTPARRSTVATP